MSEKEGYKKTAYIYVAGIIVLMIFNIIWNCYGTVQYILADNIKNEFIGLFIDFNNRVGLFNQEIYPKLLAGVLLIIWTIQQTSVPSLDINKDKEFGKLGVGVLLYLCSGFLLWAAKGSMMHLFNIIYIFAVALSIILLFSSISKLHAYFTHKMNGDIFNEENETFPQEERKMEHEYSINIPTKFQWQKKKRDGWINIINPFRATAVLGTPGSGKSFAIINPYIRQLTRKGFAIFIYDYKYPALTEIAYANYLLHKEKNPKHKFYVINFDNPEFSARCNPLEPSLMTDIADAYQASYTIMLNLNKTWITKQGDFFVESPIILFASTIWYLKLYEGGKYCTLPHAIQLLNQPYTKLFPLLNSRKELKNYLSAFMDAWEGDAQDQLQGQIASAKIPLSRISSPQLYWVLTGNDFTLDINDPEAPRSVCIGNNSERQDIYGAVLGLYNSKIVSLINKPNRNPSAVIVDELPTIFFRGIDNLIATARSNKVAVCLGFQDMSQLTRDYGDKEAKVIQQTIGNYFSGQVSGDTAKFLSTRFGKNLQTKQSISKSESGASVSFNYQQDVMIPESVIAGLSQGQFVGNVVDDFGMEIPQKIFRCNIVVDMDEVARENEIIAKHKTPQFYSFMKKITDSEGKIIEEKDMKDEIILKNYEKIIDDISQLVEKEYSKLELEEANIQAE